MGLIFKEVEIHSIPLNSKLSPQFYSTEEELNPVVNYFKAGRVNRLNLYCIGAIVLCTLICFSNFYTLQFQMEWDDYWVVINNYTNQGLSIKNLEAVFSNFYHGQYSPINEIYYILIKEVFGYDPFYFHLFSLILHLLNSLLINCLLFRVSFTAFGMNKMSSIRIAGFSALFFAIHPLNVEAVCWISASKIPLYAFFYLFALHFYITYLLDKKIGAFFLSIVCFILAFGAKEQAVTYPLALLLLDYTYGRNMKSWRVWFEKMPLFLTSLFFGLLTIRSQGGSSSDASSSYSIFERLILMFDTLSQYITQSVIPVNLSYLYPFPFQPGQAIGNSSFVLSALLLLLIFFVREAIKTKWLFFGMAFFLIHIGLALNVIGLSRFSLTADRYAYLSLIGVSFLLGYVLNYVVCHKRKYYRLSLSAVVFYFLYLGVYSYNRIEVWKDSETLKSSIRGIIRSRSDYEEIKKGF